jgi:hypothetical protein
MQASAFAAKLPIVERLTVPVLCYLATCSSSRNSWWTVAAPMIQADAELSPLLHRTMHILLTVLHLRLPAAWKILQLSVVMLWNAAVQSREYSIAASHCLAVI